MSWASNGRLFFDNRIMQAFLGSPGDTAELSVGLSAMGLGAWLLIPQFETFAAGGASIYREMAAVMPEEGWGVLMLVLGLLSWAGILIGSRVVRQYTMVAMFVLWMSIGLMMASGDIAATGAPMYVSEAVISFIALIRLQLVAHLKKYPSK